MTPHPDEGTLHAFIDGELSAADAAALEAHAAECGQCAAALAEARGFVAGASRAISALDAAPSSASRPVISRAPVSKSAPQRSRPVVFGVPFARAAALLLLVGGSAVVINRSASDDAGPSSVESLAADGALTEERATVAAAAQAAPAATSNASPPPAAPVAGTDMAERQTVGAGAVAQKRLASTTAAPGASLPPSTEAQLGRIAGSAADVATTAPSVTMPAPSARTVAPAEISLSAASSPVRVMRYRTKEGVTLTLTEEPLQTSFAEESAAPRRGQTRATAQAAAPVINSYRWSSVEQGRSYTLTGPLSVAELEAAAKRLQELERLP